MFTGIYKVTAISSGTFRLIGLINIDYIYNSIYI